MTLSQRADALEEQMAADLEERVPVRAVLYTSGDRDPRLPPEGTSSDPEMAGKKFLMGHDKRLPKMPDKPTLMDFYRLRFSAGQHMLQSARLAQKNGCEEKIVIACLLHDIGVLGFIRSDHGYWGAQLVEPYVTEEVSWAIRAHQVLRFFPDPEYGYEYPELYITFFGADYKPEPYISREYETIKKHKWYATARLITCNDLYSFDPDVRVELEEFTDVVARNFRQPEEGLGWDSTPSSHMWRTINWPTRFL
jgi:hypothetical protein